MTTAPASTLPDVRDGLTVLERITVRAVASAKGAKGEDQTRSSRTVASATRREPVFPASDIYAALVRFTQGWVTHYPLITGSGDFGSADGAPAAGSVATRASLSEVGHALVDELNLPEDDPGQRLHLKAGGQVLPGPLPNLLANGTTTPDATFLPHHLGELADAITARLTNPDISLDAIRDIIPGPDFATPAEILDDGALESIYASGQGQLRIRFDGSHGETTINVDATAIVDGQPKRLGLLDQIDEYIEHRRSVLRRKHRSKHEADLDKIIAHDLSELAERFAGERRTQIVRAPA